MSRIVRIVLAVVLVSLVTSPAAAYWERESSYWVGERRPPTEFDWVAEMRHPWENWHPNAFRAEAQRSLSEKGFYAGPIDGWDSPAFRTGVWKFQKSKGLPATAQLDRPTSALLVPPQFGYYTSARNPSDFGSK